MLCKLNRLKYVSCILKHGAWTSVVRVNKTPISILLAGLKTFPVDIVILLIVLRFLEFFWPGLSDLIPWFLRIQSEVTDHQPYSQAFLSF